MLDPKGLSRRLTLAADHNVRFLGARAIRFDRDLVILLGLAAAVGLVYMAVVPPWQVPDEPRHFAYVRSLWHASRGEDGSSAFSEHEILRSMEDHHWHELIKIPYPDTPPQSFDDIPFFQLSAPPQGRQPVTYYALAEQVVSLSGQTDVDTQLYVVRLLSAVLGVVVVAIAFLTARTLLPDAPRFSFTVGSVVALFPERAFISDGVNNDNLAIVAGSFAILVLARLVARGPSRWLLIGYFGSILLLVESKATALAVVPAMAIYPAAIAVHEIARRWSAGIATVIVGASLASLGLLTWRLVDTCDALAWNKSDGMPCSRIEAPGPGGAYALRVRDDDVDVQQSLIQLISPYALPPLRGQTVTFGAWVRTPRPPQVGSLQLFDGTTWNTKQFTADGEWRFIVSSAKLNPGVYSLMVQLNSTDSAPDATGEVLYSGVLVVQGDIADQEIPVIVDDGRSIRWNGQLLDNLVENGSASRGLLELNQSLPDAIRQMDSRVPYQAVQELFDRGTYQPLEREAYTRYVAIIIDSFWAQFGWMNLVLARGWYVGLYGVTSLGIAGTLCFIARNLLGFGGAKDRLPVVLGSASCLVAVASAFTITFLREIPPWGQSQGRYALPIIVPFAIVLTVGLHELCPSIARRWLAPALIVFFGVLNVECIVGVIIPGSQFP